MVHTVVKEKGRAARKVNRKRREMQKGRKDIWRKGKSRRERNQGRKQD